MPENLKLLESLLIALALGVLIGAERGIARVRQRVEEKTTFAGIRTFTLIALLGALSLHFTNYFGKVFFVVSFFGFVLLVTAAYIVTSKKEKDVGTTTEITAILTFFYGSLCMTEYRLVAIVLAIFTTVILYTKKPAYAFLGRVTDEEFYATLKFAIIAFVVLPFLPKDDYLGFFNPHRIWLILEVYIVNKAMLDKVALPMIIMFILGMIGALFLWKRSKAEEEIKTIDLKSPFTLNPALKFTVFFALIIFLVTFANKYLGVSGVYVTSAIGGLANLDVPTVSLASLAYRDITAEVATLGIVIAACVNTVSKAGIAFLLGSKDFSKLVIF